MLIRVSTSFSLSPCDLAVLVPTNHAAHPCAPAESVFLPPKVRRTHLNSMSSLVRAEMHSKPDRPSLKSPSGSSRLPKPADTQLALCNSRSVFSSPSRRQRNSPCILSLPPSPKAKATASANKETPSTPSKVRKYSPLTPSTSVSSFGTGSFAFPTPRTPLKRSVLFS